MKKGIESIGKFVVSGGDTTKLLESIEEALDQMTSLVPMPVDRTFIFPIATGRNIGLSTTRLDGCYRHGPFPRLPIRMLTTRSGKLLLTSTYSGMAGDWLIAVGHTHGRTAVPTTGRLLTQ